MEMRWGAQSSWWRCLACGEVFLWHPSTSGLLQPLGCGACDAPEIEPVATGKVDGG
jgi:hypothetical protein